MDCLSCGGRLARSKTTYTASRRGFHLILDDVPAWVCEQCREPLFDEATVTEIQRMLSAVEQGISGLAAGPVAA